MIHKKSKTLIIIIVIAIGGFCEVVETAHRESINYQTKRFEEILERSDAFLEDSALDTFFSSVINNLTDTISPDWKSIRVRVLKSSTFNAFAAPHGTIYLCTGLLARIENGSQVAALLAHEMTHIINDHTYQNLVAIKKKALTSANIQFGLEWLIGSMASSSISNLTLKSAVTGYSRDLEREADSAGLFRMKKGGYPTIEFLNLFTILKTYIEQYNISEPYFFATHPAIEERIGNYYTLTRADTNIALNNQVINLNFDSIIKNVLIFDGSMKIASGDLQTAEENFSRVLKVDSTNTEALYNLGTITRLRSGSEFNEYVVKWYHRSMNFSTMPLGSQACCDLGAYYYKTGRNDSAYVYLDSFLNNNQTSPWLPIVKDYLKKCKK
jgi:tetratricopeptide (TPR) repeat protein